jgi:DNA-binding MarR family transcriptional regulator
MTIEIGNDPPAEIWCELARSEEFRTTLLRILRNELGHRPASAVYKTLDQAGVTALNGDYADLCARIGQGESGRALSTLFEVTTAFGQPQHRRTNLSVGIDAPLTAVGDGPLAVFNLEESLPSTITVRLNAAFEDRNPDQRHTICQLLAALAQVFDVRVVTSAITERFLRRHHWEDLPGVSEACIDSESTGQITELVERAWTDLDSTVRPISILRSIADDPAATQSYQALAADTQVTRARVRQCIGQLREHELVATAQRVNGTIAELLPAGRQLLERVDEQIGRQRRLDELDEHTIQNVSEAGQTTDHGRVIPPAHENPSTAKREVEAEAVAAHDTEQRANQREWTRGAVNVRYLSRCEHTGTIASAKPDGIGLVDHSIEPQ